MKADAAPGSKDNVVFQSSTAANLQRRLRCVLLSVCRVLQQKPHPFSIKWETLQDNPLSMNEGPASCRQDEPPQKASGDEVVGGGGTPWHREAGQPLRMSDILRPILNDLCQSRATMSWQLGRSGLAASKMSMSDSRAPIESLTFPSDDVASELRTCLSVFNCP